MDSRADGAAARRAEVIVGPPLEKVAPPAPRPARLGKFRHPEDGHDHRIPLSLQLMVAISVLGLLASAVIMVGYIHDTNARITTLEQYVQGRGEYRDREQARLEEQMRADWCRVLDMLPEGQFLDVLRAEKDCGPGIPRPTPVP